MIDIPYVGGPMDGKTTPMTSARCSLIPDWEGSILCSTPDGPVRCFTTHRYEKKTMVIWHGEPYRNDKGFREYHKFEYVGREPAVPCGPIIGGDRLEYSDTVILNRPGEA